MATVPLSATDIRLLSNIPFTNDYKNTRWFDSKTQQTNYFLNKNVVHQMDRANFQRIEGYNYISVNENIDDLWGTNYLMFRNSDYNNKYFYAFVTKLEYKNKMTTHVHFQVDVFQTWLFEMDFKPSYVIREHCKLWNNDGSPVINTVDEGLNYGTDYETVDVQNWKPYNDIYFLVVVSKSAVHETTDGQQFDNQPLANNNGLPQPLTYYVHPFRMASANNQPIVSVNGSPYMGISEPKEFIQRLSEITTTANNIASIYVTDYIGINADYNNTDDSLAFGDSVERAIISDGTYTLETLCVKDVLDYQTMSKNFGNKYNGFHSVSESKLYMYPYTLTILDDFKGNRVVLKNEYIDNNNLVVTARGSMGTSNKVVYGVNDYLTENLNTNNRLLPSIEYALVNNNPNDLPVITDMLSAYLQGNINSLENQRNSIAFNGVMNGVNSAIGGVASGISRNPVGVASAGTDMVQGAGNTVLQLQGINAKMKDIDNVPPSLTKMGSNTAFDYGNNYDGLFVIKKQITSEYRRKLTDFFNMFGYKLNEVKIPNFHTRKYWNYVQTSSCNILGNFNNEDLQELKSVFDNGITLWHTDDVGNYSLENGVI